MSEVGWQLLESQKVSSPQKLTLLRRSKKTALDATA